ncbi:MAG: cysteine--tRNA ligase [Candidatus Shapirobacteria bacterium]
MKIRLYNTLKRKKEVFVPLRAGKVGIYSCGPTVYWNQHIGHLYAYIHWDVLIRLFRYLNYQVKWVMNITDVGHLTSDEDAGEDKMEKGAKREGLSVWEIADKYLKQFLESIDLVNISKPDYLPRATKHIKEQIELIKRMEKRGFVYRTKIGLALDTQKFPKYADFAKLDLTKQKAGARSEIDPEKKAPWDPFLWVTGRSSHIMQWDSPWGKGFPGWHIECTAMSTKYLGEHFDIHTGGMEHICVHHTNEIAQGFAAFGGKTANYWLHNGWLRLKKEKMSKSLGNFILIDDVVKRDFDPLAFRYLVLTSHYRQGLIFDWEALKSAQSAYNKLAWEIKGAKKKKALSEEAAEYKNRFLSFLANDLGAPQALGSLWKMLKDNKLADQEKKSLLLDFDQILGLGLKKGAKEKRARKTPKDIEKLAQQRAELRERGDFKKADVLRKKIKKKGYLVEDHSKGGYRLLPVLRVDARSA